MQSLVYPYSDNASLVYPYSELDMEQGEIRKALLIK